MTKVLNYLLWDVSTTKKPPYLAREGINKIFENKIPEKEVT